MAARLRPPRQLGGGVVVEVGDATPVLDALLDGVDDACAAVPLGVEGTGAAAAAPVRHPVVAVTV